MTSIGNVLNKALNKHIPVLLSDSGSGFKRLTGAIDQAIKDNAFAKVKERFESGAMFNDEDMKQMEQLKITNMSHSSAGDPNAHYSVQGESASGTKIKADTLLRTRPNRL